MLGTSHSSAADGSWEPKKCDTHECRTFVSKQGQRELTTWAMAQAMAWRCNQFSSWWLHACAHSDSCISAVVGCAGMLGQHSSEAAAALFAKRLPPPLWQCSLLACSWSADAACLWRLASALHGALACLLCEPCCLVSRLGFVHTDSCCCNFALGVVSSFSGL